MNTGNNNHSNTIQDRLIDLYNNTTTRSNNGDDDVCQVQVTELTSSNNNNNSCKKRKRENASTDILSTFDYNYHIRIPLVIKKQQHDRPIQSINNSSTVVDNDDVSTTRGVTIRTSTTINPSLLLIDHQQQQQSRNTTSSAAKGSSSVVVPVVSDKNCNAPLLFEEYSINTKKKHIKKSTEYYKDIIDSYSIDNKNNNTNSITNSNDSNNSNPLESNLTNVSEKLQQLRKVYLYGLQYISKLQDIQHAPDAILSGNFIDNNITKIIKK